MKFEYPIGATPLNPDEAIGLIPLHITNQSQLNEWEAENILKAENWVFSKKHINKLFTIEFVKLLHKEMFNKTWKWSGTFRITEKNIGISPAKISTELKKLLDDVDYQITNQTYPINEIAYRLHHRLVWIHPFANGNGRHARLFTDVVLTQSNEPRFSWGQQDLSYANNTRQKYIKALQAADKGDYKKLAKFVRS